MNKYYIEEIIKYNYKISISCLIYKKLQFKWWQPIIFSIVIISILFSFNFLYKKDYLPFYLSFSFVIASCVVTALILRNRIKAVIRAYYQYALTDNGDYDYKSLLEIQKVELVNLLGADLIKKESLLFLIDKLTLSNQRNAYSYVITVNVILITINIFLGVFFPKFLDFTKGYNDFMAVVRSFIPVIILYVFLFLTIDKFIVKDIVLGYRNSKNRIVRTLENIYLDKYIE